MKKLFVLFIVVIGLLLVQSCYKEEVVFDTESDNNLELPLLLRFNDNNCGFDFESSSIRFSIENESINNYSPFVEFQEYSTVLFEGIPLINESINNLGNIEIDHVYEVVVQTNEITKTLQLSFTNLPIVQIITPNTINDEPKTIGRIVVNYTNNNLTQNSQFIGIEYRGGTSIEYPKKSYGFSLKGSVDLNDDVSNSFFDMKENNDWILDAMYIDKSRLRNKISFDLWNSLEGENHYGIQSEFVELYINNSHQGLYCFNENINAELLGITNNNSVLYKATSWADGATRFENLSSDISTSYYWDGWEQKHPNPKEYINWEPLYELRNLIVNGNDQTFISEIFNKIDIDNFIDYYIFLNLIKAGDNTGKNTFLYQENSNEKFKLIPWDNDGTWGYNWDGSSTNQYAILTNDLYNRLIDLNPNNFVQKLKLRWTFLNSGVFSIVNLDPKIIIDFETINKSGVIEIENDKWGFDINLGEEQTYLTTWLELRKGYLNNYFESL